MLSEEGELLRESRDMVVVSMDSSIHLMLQDHVLSPYQEGSTCSVEGEPSSS